MIRATVRVRICHSAFLAIAAGVMFQICATPARSQEITDLGTLAGGWSSQATGINAGGQVVGFSSTADGTTHAFLYAYGTMTDLGTLGSNSSFAYGINASGEVVGTVEDADFSQSAFVYSGGVMTALGTLAGGTGSYGAAINDSGQVAGYAPMPGAIWYPILYSDGVVTNVDTIGGTQAAATGINASGQVVGWVANADGVIHAFLYTGGSMIDLGAYGTESVAFGMNASGQVVGYFVPGVYRHAFLYSNGVMTDLGAPLPALESYAFGINASGQIAGALQMDGSTQHAALYSGSSWTDLNSLLPPASGWVLESAEAINDSGQIVGYGTIGGQRHAFLLTQAPILSGLGPTSAAVGGTAFTLAVDGANFIPGATVNWNGTALETTFVSGTQLTATVPASESALRGTASVTVTTTAGTTAASSITIRAGRLLPGVPAPQHRTGKPAAQ